jgi:hypothetical protein
MGRWSKVRVSQAQRLQVAIRRRMIYVGDSNSCLGVYTVLSFRILILPLLFLVGTSVAATAADKKVRLFILSGQSNMAGLDPKVSFTPAVEKAFADDEVIVVKHARRRPAHSSLV